MPRQWRHHRLLSEASRGVHRGEICESYRAANDTQELHMVGTLIESRGRRQRRVRESIASALVHSALIAAAVFATAHESVSAPPPKPPRVEIVTLNPPPVPVDPKPVARPVSPNAVPTAPAVPRIAIPVIVPVGIPDVPIGAPPTDPNWAAQLGQGAGPTCTYPCGTSVAKGS